MKVLLIDDLRDFRPDYKPEELVIARTLPEAFMALENTSWDSIWLDHDLGLDENGDTATIGPILEHLCELAFNGTPVQVNVIMIHTSNPVGAQQMKQALTTYGYPAVNVDASEFFEVK